MMAVLPCLSGSLCAAHAPLRGRARSHRLSYAGRAQYECRWEVRPFKELHEFRIAEAGSSI